MRALVTGGAGFIGSAIARELAATGDDVRVLDDLSTGFKENVPDGIECIEADLRDADAVRAACEKVEVIFHQGAARSVPRSVDDPLLTESCNAIGTLNVLQGAEAAGVRRVVYASTSSAYGDTGDGFNREDMVPKPLSPYAVSKLAGEHYCHVWTRLKGVSTVSLRYFNVFGPGQHPESRYSAVFPAFISALSRGQPPEIHWDGRQARDFTFVDDAVRANLAAATADERVDGEVFNIGGGGAKTVNDVLKSVSAAMGLWIDPIHRPKRPGDVRRTHADIRRARQLLDWRPQAEWEVAVKATVAWFTEHIRP
jgi:UDP-glucose 4-epimerase